MRMVETSRAAAFLQKENENSFIDAEVLYKKYFFFILTSTMQIRKKLYDIDYIKAPVNIDVELDHIGKTSFQFKHSSYVNNFDKPIFVTQTKTVLVSKSTRRPVRLPDGWVEKYSKLLPTQGNPMERLDMSDQINNDDDNNTECCFTVQAADVDGYLHTNWASYVKHCYNAFVEHSIAKGLSKDPIDIFRQVENLSVVYKNESSIGDLLKVQVCSHQSNPDVFHFIISKDKDVCCECKLAFHPR